MAYSDDTEIFDIMGISSGKVSEDRENKARRFLKSICAEAEDEISRLLDEKLGLKRRNTAIKITGKAAELYNQYSNTGVEYAHPQLVCMVLEQGSWSTSYLIQDMWSGLLASSCAPAGKDDSNLVFMSLLNQMTRLEAKVLDYACKTSEKYILKGGGIAARSKIVSLEVMQNFSGVNDYHRLDRELDHLRFLGIISGGFDPRSTSADITPTQLGLHMFVRCQGFAMPPVEYFRLISRQTQQTFSA